MESFGPPIEHWKQCITAFHVGKAQYPGPLTDIEERSGVKRIGIRCSHITKQSIWIFAQLDELAHRGLGDFGAHDIGEHATRHLHRHKLIATNVCIGGYPKVL